MKAMTWTTSSGEKVVIDGDVAEALAAIDRVFPGAKAIWWRKPPGGEWKQP